MAFAGPYKPFWPFGLFDLFGLLAYMASLVFSTNVDLVDLHINLDSL
jgi:hypothetical protein